MGSESGFCGLESTISAGISDCGPVGRHHSLWPGNGVVNEGFIIVSRH